MLQTRKTLDRLNPMSSSGRQTNELGKAKQDRLRELGKMLDGLNTVLEATHEEQAWDSELISRCEKCKNQILKLIEIIRDY
jgi:hypothetical protein